MRQSLVAFGPWDFPCVIHILGSIPYDCHICIKTIKMKECKDWPSYSPDLNPIENICEIIKSQLMKKEINKRSELILEIKNAYDSISDEVISSLIESFPSRL